GLAHNHFRGNICQGVAGSLAQEGHGTGRAGIHLNDKHIVFLVHNELDVVKADDANAQSQLLGVLEDNPLHLIGDTEGGVHADGVAAVNAGTFHQLHDAGHKHIDTVADSVNLHL